MEAFFKWLHGLSDGNLICFAFVVLCVLGGTGKFLLKLLGKDKKEDE